jgi:hypothetical protein
MRQMSGTPSVVPDEGDHTVYIVLDDLGDLGSAYRETDPDDAGLQTVVADLLSGQFNDPVRVVAFNLIEGWAADASTAVATELVEVARRTGQSLSRTARAFYERHTGENVPAGVACH